MTTSDARPSEAEARAILGRLQHEVDHAGDRVLRFVRGEEEIDGSPVTLDYRSEEDGGGFIEVAGTLASEDGLDGADLDFTFRRWSGRHGGFGLVALDGRASARLLIVDPTEGAESFYADVRAVVGLAGGGALEPAPDANACYTVFWEPGSEMTANGTLGGFDLETLSPAP